MEGLLGRGECGLSHQDVGQRVEDLEAGVRVHGAAVEDRDDADQQHRVHDVQQRLVRAHLVRARVRVRVRVRNRDRVRVGWGGAFFVSGRLSQICEYLRG